MFENSFLSHFMSRFIRVMWYLRSLHLALIALILGGGIAVGAVESISLADAVYFAFITGLTVGDKGEVDGIREGDVLDRSNRNPAA